MSAGNKGTVLITGSGARIGRTIALDLAHNGWSVAVHYRSSRQDAEDLVAEIKSTTGARAQAFAADLADEAETAALIPQVSAALGPVTALINNASTFENDTIETMTRASWDRHIETNLRAPLLLSQIFGSELAEGEKGCIVNLLDQRVLKLTPQFLSYTLSKTALWTLTQTLAQALAPNIRVNAVGPGPTLRNERQSEQDFQRQVDATLLKRRTDPQEIADAIRFILSAEAMTGQMIAIDGGQHLIWQTPDVTGVIE